MSVTRKVVNFMKKFLFQTGFTLTAGGEHTKQLMQSTGANY